MTQNFCNILFFLRKDYEKELVLVHFSSIIDDHDCCHLFPEASDDQEKKTHPQNNRSSTPGICYFFLPDYYKNNFELPDTFMLKYVKILVRSLSQR